MKAGDTYHLADPVLKTRPTCGARLAKWVSPVPTLDQGKVNCPVCLSIMAGSPGSQVMAAGGGASSEKPITLTEYNNAGPKRKPPRMENLHGQVDGVFKFYDIDYYHRDAAFRQTDALEVVPQQNGNVEITLGESIFTLSHLDRADLIRALLCDFHYSPEKDGPNDDA